MAMTDYIVVTPRLPVLAIYDPPNEVVNFRRLSPAKAGGAIGLPPEYTIPKIYTVDVWDSSLALRQLGLAGMTIVPRKGVVLNKPGDGGSGGPGAIPEFGQLWPLRG